MMRYNRTQFPGRRGFTLYETLAAILLLVLFFDAAGNVFKSTVLLSSASQDLCDHTSQIDSALRQLRIDVWNCRTITLADPRSLDLSLADGTKVSWKIDARNCAVRADATGQTERWNAVGAGWLLSTDKVSLAISDGSAAPTRMVSQILLAQSEQP